ncbi:MAG: helix-turn-helix domain-containing protein [Crocinitomicaceae bacterium]|nr:helix-turn-helix domain-containing protein [Crocinitomicaceae bacterium]
MQEIIIHSIFTGICGFLFLYFLLAPKKQWIHYSFMSIFFLSLGLGFSEHILASEEFQFDLVHIDLLFLPPIALFYYAMFITRRYSTLPNYHYALVLLVIIELTFNISTWLPGLISEVMIGLLSEVFNFSSIVLSIVLLVIVVKKIKRHHEEIKNYFSSIEDINLNWLKIIALIFILFNVMWLVDDSFIYIFSDNLVSPIIAEISIIFSYFIVVWVGYHALNQLGSTTSMVLYGNNDPPKSEDELPLRVVRNLTEGEELLFAQLIQKVKSDELYKKTNLSLKDISEFLDVSDKIVSKIINVKTSDNFYNFINHYRIEHFKERIKAGDSRHMTFEALALESGFKSKSTFYGVFKRMEDKTPKEFIHSISKND